MSETRGICATCGIYHNREMQLFLNKGKTFRFPKLSGKFAFMFGKLVFFFSGEKFLSFFINNWRNLGKLFRVLYDILVEHLGISYSMLCVT